MAELVCVKCGYSLDRLSLNGRGECACPECGVVQRPMPRAKGRSRCWAAGAAVVAVMPMVAAWMGSRTAAGWGAVGMLVYVVPAAFGLSLVLGIGGGLIARAWVGHGKSAFAMTFGLTFLGAAALGVLCVITLMNAPGGC